MKIAFVMDPLEKVKAHKDTSYYLMLAAKERGNEVFYFNQATMQTTGRNVDAVFSKLDVHPSIDKPFTVLETQRGELSQMDVIFVRTDPPFDRAYSYATLLLDLIGDRTLVVNRPSGLRNWNEKLAALHYVEYTPDTLVSREEKQILNFAENYPRVTIKPVDGHGGEGVDFFCHDDSNAEQKIAQQTHHNHRWVIVQEYLKASTNGDKRILLVDGEPIGAVLRVHAQGQELNNLDQGAKAVPAEINDAELEICRAIKPGLLRQGIFFCGIDVIGEKLIEVNVTSPTCLQELCKFSKENHHHDIIERLEKRIT